MLKKQLRRGKKRKLVQKYFLQEELVRFPYVYAMPDVYSYVASIRYGMFFSVRNSLEKSCSQGKKTRLQCLLDVIMMLTFFDAVVIAIATCSYRDSNMMLST